MDIRLTVAAAGLHGDEGWEVSGVVGEEQGALVTINGRTLEGKVDATERDWG